MVSKSSRKVSQTREPDSKRDNARVHWGQLVGRFALSRNPIFPPAPAPTLTIGPASNVLLLVATIRQSAQPRDDAILVVLIKRGARVVIGLGGDLDREQCRDVALRAEFGVHVELSQYEQRRRRGQFGELVAPQSVRSVRFEAANASFTVGYGVHQCGAAGTDLHEICVINLDCVEVLVEKERFYLFC